MFIGMEDFFIINFKVSAIIVIIFISYNNFLVDILSFNRRKMGVNYVESNQYM